MGILVLEFGSLEILNIEQYAPGANITTGSDAMWYVIVTISTVGYGDRYPVTNRGRFFGSMIIIIGVGIFGTFTGYLANLFLSPSKKPTATPRTIGGGRRAVQSQPAQGAHGPPTGRHGRDRPPLSRPTATNYLGDLSPGPFAPNLTKSRDVTVTRPRSGTPVGAERTDQGSKTPPSARRFHATKAVAPQQLARRT